MRGGVFWRDMGVVNLPSGKPTMELTGGAAAAPRGDPAGPYGPHRCVDHRRFPAGPGDRHHLRRSRLSKASLINLHRVRMRAYLPLCPDANLSESIVTLEDQGNERMSDEANSKEKSPRAEGLMDTLRVILQALILALSCVFFFISHSISHPAR